MGLQARCVFEFRQCQSDAWHRPSQTGRAVDPMSGIASGLIGSASFRHCNGSWETSGKWSPASVRKPFAPSVRYLNS